MSKKQQKSKDGIYFQEMTDHSTHYIAYKDGKILNPYYYYQFPNTHGFCQFFAFFMYTGDTKEFTRVNFNGKFRGSQFKTYVNNSYHCFHKILKLLKMKKYKPIYTAFENDFKNSSSTPRKKYGIKRGTTFKQFLKDAEKLPYENFFLEIAENYRNYWIEMNKEGSRDQFEKQADDFFQQQRKTQIDQKKFDPDESLCVIPTDGETQFESFQSIIANSFRAGRNSVYSKLLKLNNIKLIESNIYDVVHE